MKILLAIILIVAYIELFYFFRQNLPPLSPVNSTKSDITLLQPLAVQRIPSQTISYVEQEATYSASWIEVDNSKKLSLYVNSEKNTTKDFQYINNCSSVTSGGFYDTTDKPIGLFISKKQIIQPFRPNFLLNGIFSVKNNNASITDEPVKDADLALQSGPQLFRDGKALQLNIHNDEPARRVAVGITTKKSILFIAIYLNDNIYSGPKLSSLPQHVSIFESKTKIRISDALNLDGGSASSLITDTVSINELTHVGSFFCIKNEEK